MRISPTKLVQLIESEPPELVLLDETTGSEIVLSPVEADKLHSALDVLLPHLHGMFKLRPKARDVR